MKSALTAITCCLFSICATTNQGDFDLLKPTLDAFHQGMRWKDIRRIAPLVVPEKRAAFLKASEDRDDAKNLFVTDYTLEDCQIHPSDGKTAVCMSKVSWYRLPSASEKTVTVATTLKWQGGAWLIDRQSEGPFVEDLSMNVAPKSEPKGEPKAEPKTDSKP